MGSAQSTQSDRQDGVHPALFEYDILTMIFETFDPQDRIGRSTCARCARVCRAWNEPASRAIWSRTRWRLSDLYNVLWRYTQKADADASGVVVYNDLAQNLRAYLQSSLRQHPTLQQCFLRCASRVRQLYVSQVTGLSKDEVRLLQRLLTWCNGTTFLPGLLSLSWIESPETDRLLSILIPTCLEHLELIIDSATAGQQVDDLLSKLPQAAPFLKSMVLHVYNAGFTPSSLLGNACLRRLSIFGHYSLAPDQLQCVLSLPILEFLDTRIRDFGACCDPINALSALKSLDCHGTYEDLTALTSHLLAPNIHHLGLRVDTVDGRYDPSAQRRLSQSLAARQIPTLRSLHLGYRNVQSAFTPASASASASHPRPPVSLQKDMFQPLYGKLKLESLVVEVEEHVPLTDEDAAKLAHAWPTLRTLSLAFRNGLAPPGAEVVRPSLRALVLLARGCPALDQLKLEAGKGPAYVDGQRESGLDTGGRGHPLRRLCLSGWGEAPFVDALFPGLDVKWGRANAPAQNLRMWDMVQQFQEARRRREEATRTAERQASQSRASDT